MSAPFRFAFALIAFSVACCAVFSLRATEETAAAAVNAGAAVSVLNALSALALASFGASRGSMQMFFATVFGGMLFRLGTTLIGLLVAIRILDLPAIPFAVSLLAFSTLFTALEAFQWSRQDFSPRVQRS